MSLKFSNATLRKRFFFKSKNGCTIMSYLKQKFYKTEMTIFTVAESKLVGSICCGSWYMMGEPSTSSRWPESCTASQTVAQTPSLRCTAWKGWHPNIIRGNQKGSKLCFFSLSNRLNQVTLKAPQAWQQYLKENIRVSRVEDVRQPFFYSFYHLWPHRVHQEIVTRHCVSFVTEE